MVVKIKTGKIYGLQPPLVATPSPPIYLNSRVFLGVFFFGYIVDCVRPFLKIACLQLPIQVFKEWIDMLGFSFFMCSRVDMKTRIF